MGTKEEQLLIQAAYEAILTVTHPRVNKDRWRIKNQDLLCQLRNYLADNQWDSIGKTEQEIQDEAESEATKAAWSGIYN